MNEKELFEKINNDKDYRSKILIDLNVALQLAERMTYTLKGEISPEEYKLAVVSLEVENQQLKNNWNELRKWLEEEHKRNINWYGNLTHHDKQYCLYEFGATKDVLDNVQDKMQELEGKE